MKRPNYLTPAQCPLRIGDIVEIVGCADQFCHKSESWIVDSEPFLWQGIVCVKLKGKRNPYNANHLKVNYHAITL